MAQPGRTFRIFISSTFADLKEERNALQEYVYPRLRELCAQHGARFQAIDLRWGVSAEAGLDQRTMTICLDEIERCRRTTPRPNFILLLGDRYGWCPLPPIIPAQEFEDLCGRISSDEQRELNDWYLRDENAVSAEYCLKPRERGGPYEEFDRWEGVERRLRAILLKSLHDTSMPIADSLKYRASATEQEIHRGALRVHDAPEHVYCFLRTIRNLPLEETAGDFVDLVKENGHWLPDEDRRRALEELKEELREHFPEQNIHQYEAEWIRGGMTRDHIGSLPRDLDQCLSMSGETSSEATLCVDVWKELSKIILRQIAQLETKDALDDEIEAHHAFGEHRSRTFVGRAAMLDAVADYIRGHDNVPLAIHSVSGSGKSALMARVAQNVREVIPNAEVVVRFIGATPESSDGRALLQSICQEISRSYGSREPVPAEYRELVGEFRYRLSLAKPDRPLVLFLDALDQLADAESARNLVWLPADLPDNVRLVVSTLPGECLAALDSKLQDSRLVELEPMPADEAEALLDIWLEEAARRLQPHQRQQVLTNFERSSGTRQRAEPAGLPLYLRLAFEEARLWKSYTPTSQTTLRPDIGGLIRQLFGRLSDDANHGRVVVERSLAYLATAKNGLSEDEMLDVLSRDNDVFGDFMARARHEPPEQRLPVVVWSRLFFDLEPYLNERAADGTSLLAFYHRQLVDVVNDEYLLGDTRRQRHRHLASYFSEQPLEIERAAWSLPNLRKLSELPFQETMGELWEELHETLTDFRFLERKAATGTISVAGSTSYGSAALQEDYRLALEKFPRE